MIVPPAPRLLSRAVALAMLCSAGVCFSATPPADHPRRGPLLQRLAEAVEQADLSADQKTRVDRIIDNAADRFAKLRSGAETGNLREQAQAIARETREQLRDVLTPAQQNKLAGTMFGLREGDPPAAPRLTETPRPPETPEPAAPAKPAPATRPAATAELTVGQPAPDFRLPRADRQDRKLVSLADYRGKPTVLIFGSYSSPTFRDKAAKFEDLRKAYRTRANFLIVYTREGYAADEWPTQRNRDEKIDVPLATTLEDRMKMARSTLKALNLSTEMVVDDMDDAVATAYDAMPNGAAVLDAQGKLVGRLRWADPFGVQVLLDPLVKSR